MKLIGVALILAGISCPACAQSFYLKVGGGYSFPLASYSLGANSSDVEHLETNPETGFYDYAGSEIKDEEVTGSFNSGVAAMATVGYLLSSNAGVEVNMGYVFGRTYRILSEQRQVLDGNQVRYSSSTSTSWNATNAFVAPSVMLTTGDATLKPYVSAGPVFVIATIDEKKRNFSDYDGTPDLTQQEARYSGGVSVGLRGTAGIDIRLNETFCLFSEVAFMGMSYHPNEKETLKYEVNGEDQVPLWPASQRKVVYVKETGVNVSVHDNSPPGPSRPRKELRTYFGMSSISAIAGLKVLL